MEKDQQALYVMRQTQSTQTMGGVLCVLRLYGYHACYLGKKRYQLKEQELILTEPETIAPLGQQEACVALVDEELYQLKRGEEIILDCTSMQQLEQEARALLEQERVQERARLYQQHHIDPIEAEQRLSRAREQINKGIFDPPTGKLRDSFET